MGAIRTSSRLSLLVGALSSPIVTVVFRLRTTGVRRVPASGGVVLAANDWSSLDPWPLGSPLVPRRYLRFREGSELFSFRPGGITSVAGGSWLPRGESDAAIGTAVELARGGNVALVFPAGTRRRKGLRTRHEQCSRTGAAWIALRARVPLVLAAIAGTDRLLPPSPLRVAYGPPIDTSDLVEDPPLEAVRIATEWLREGVLRLEGAHR
ncbi:MAG: 1-acyl-sn-glycerol-3-phosphate acyltransferase [Gaiellaceae bacterium]|nr:1-acyl-sn-glycerol-3-phosphate acyltransferase [Gaiellaceae bacterium]